MFSGFQDLWLLFKLNRSRWLTRQIIEYTVYPAYLVDDSAHYCLQYCKWNLCTFGGHEIDGIYGAQCNCVVVGSLVAHNTNGTHVGQGCEILVRHPGWSFAVFFLVSSYCLVHFFPVDGIGILYDADFLSIDFTDDSDTKTRAREWLTEYQMLRNSKFKTGFTNLIFEEVTQRLDDFLEINIIRKTAYIVVGFDDSGFSAKTTSTTSG